jgi:hypothetical protein
MERRRTWADRRENRKGWRGREKRMAKEGDEGKGRRAVKSTNR